MASTAILSVRIIGDASRAQTALNDTAGSAAGMQRGVERAAAGASVALVAIGAGAWEAASAASEAEQAIGAVSSVFGDYASEVQGYASQAADAVGLAEADYNQMASVLGAQLNNMGTAQADLAGETDNLIGLGADLAATFGGSTADAVSALSSLMRGERDPIERFGVSMNQAAIDAQMAEMGLTGLTGEAARSAQAQATLALLTEQTASAQGQFAREAETAAGMQARATAEWDNAVASLGEQLLPILTQAAAAFGDFAGWLQENEQLVTILVAAIAGVAAIILAIAAAMKIYAAAQAIQTAAQWASNAAWLASPMTWIIIAVIAAVAALIVIIVLVVQHWDLIAAAAAACWESVLAWFGQVGEAAAALWQGIMDWVTQAAEWIGTQIGAAIDAVVGWFTGLRDAAVGVFQTIIGWVQSVLDWLGRMASNIMPGWLSDFLGMGVMSVQHNVAPAAGIMPATMSLYNGAAGFAASPAALGLPRVPQLRAGSSDRPPVQEVHNHYTINGAIDVRSTARAIRRIVSEDERRSGRRVAAGVTWR